MDRGLIFTMMSVTVMMMAIGYGSAQVSSSPNTTPALTPPSASSDNNNSQEYLDAHNEARKEVGVSPLKWSETLAKSASLTARYQREYFSCNMSRLTNNLFGVNQLASSGLVLPPRRTVAIWLAGKAFYDYGTDTCMQGSSCSAYTQVVWRNSTQLGCAQVQCPEADASLTICFYNPPGNVKGEKPY